jgi:G3E family GTPase
LLIASGFLPYFKEKKGLKPLPSIMFVGGFLGAGKTTAIRALGETLKSRGLTAAAVTNDQAAGLVDTSFLVNTGFTAREVAGSCFCCNFEGLSRALEEIIRSDHVDIILSEPVGSCTDIVATVIRPMRDKLRDRVDTLAYSVLVEPQRWIDLTANADRYPASMRFLFDKQLEEADFIVLTKVDTLNEAHRIEMVGEVQARFPQAAVLSISAREGIGLDKWLDLVQVTPPSERWLKEIDYDEYAEAEAEMGWLNAQVWIRLPAPGDGNDLSLNAVEIMRRGIAEKGGQVGNLKILVLGDGDFVKCGTTHAAQAPALDGRFEAPLREAQITVNLRATVSPDDLSSTVRRMVDAIQRDYGAEAAISYLNTFRPAPPKPTYRYGGEE